MKNSSLREFNQIRCSDGDGVTRKLIYIACSITLKTSTMLYVDLIKLLLKLYMNNSYVILCLNTPFNTIKTCIFAPEIGELFNYALILSFKSLLQFNLNSQFSKITFKVFRIILVRWSSFNYQNADPPCVSVERSASTFLSELSMTSYI